MRMWWYVRKGSWSPDHIIFATFVVLVLNYSNAKLHADIFGTNTTLINVNGTQVQVYDRFKISGPLCHKQCIPKCCPFGSILAGNKSCLFDSQSWTLTFFQGLIKQQVVNSSIDEMIELRLLEGFPECTEDYYLEDGQEVPFQISSFGHLMELPLNNEVDISEYCLDYEPNGRIVAYTCLHFDSGNENSDSSDSFEIDPAKVFNRSMIRGPVCYKCIVKCCPFDSILTENRFCWFKYPSWTLRFFQGLNVSDSSTDEIMKEFRLFEGFPKCNYDLYLEDGEKEPFEISRFGRLRELSSDNLVDIPEYCVDYYEPYERVVALKCLPFEPEDDFDSYPFVMLISFYFLMVTFIVYATVEDLRNVHNLCVMGYISTLAINYLLLFAIDSNSTLIYDFCTPLTYAVIYTFQASFFWLNVMCFDIWWGLRKFTGVETHHKYRFLIYSLYSWGLPLAILLLIFYADSPLSGFEIKPRLGEEKCWFQNSTAALYYFYIPLTFILSTNLAFFFLTIYTLYKKLSETDEMLKRRESKRHQRNERQNFIVFTKLFIVMGICWSTELISFLLNYWEITKAQLWILTDLINTLQGLLIFVIFVCKRRVWNLLKCKLLNMELPHSSGTKSTSSTSNGVPGHPTPASIELKQVLSDATDETLKDK